VTLDLGGQCKFGPDVSGGPCIARLFILENAVEMAEHPKSLLVQRFPTHPSGQLSFLGSFEAGFEDKFYRTIRRYYPDLPDGALQPGYTGIRPKVTAPTQPPPVIFSFRD
jgi:hypothetical protein